MNMKLLLGTCLFVLYVALVVTEGFNTTTKLINSKEAERLSYPKKAMGIKKNIYKASLKKIADITEKFRDLPDDDLAFIKELDKQFKLHGGKIKIKVENNNATETKNSKRTIDGELGYGYAHNGYQYDAPKYMFYPYSQHGIGDTSASYFLPKDSKTEVSIQPSYSYELKSQTYVTHNQPQIDVPKADPPQQHTEHISTQQQTQQQHYEEPVIVLRIPGPAKYATHLQMLLQKYLEIRAAQYLHILEEAEQRNNHQQHHLQQLDYGQGNNAIVDSPIEHVEQPQQYYVPIHEQHDYTQQQHHSDYTQQQHQQPVKYPDIDNVYHSYKNRHSVKHQQAPQIIQDTRSYYSTQQQMEEKPHTPQYEQHTIQPQHQDQQQVQLQHQTYNQEQEQEQFQYQPVVQEQPQFYYTQPAEGSPATAYHQVYLVAMAPQQYQPDYEDEAAKQQTPLYVQEHANSHGHSSALPVAENNPRPSHTKVVFTNKKDSSTHDYHMYQLPSIKPNERHAPTSIPDYHQDFQQTLPAKQHYTTAETAKPEIVVITQRPYNYHAHNVKARAKGRTAYSRRQTTAKGEGLQKVH